MNASFFPEAGKPVWAKLGRAMWLGIICGALLGAAFGSIPGALVLAILGGAVGRAVSLRGADAATSNSAGPEESKSELQVLQEQMRQANRRIDLLEMQLRHGRLGKQQA